MVDKQTPVSDPVEPRTRRGRSAMDKVAVEAARGSVRTKTAADAAKTKARTRTTLLTEEQKQQEILAKQAEKKAADTRRKRRQQWADFKIRGAAFLQVAMVVGPITAPMVISWTGQSGFAQRVLDWNFVASLIYAAAYELTTIFCAWMYHEARKDGDKGWEYRAATWAFAIGAGVQQWWHYSADWNATPRSVTYSTMTAIGVVVWELYARLIHRRKMRADGKITNSRPRIGLARWFRYTRISWTAWSGSVLHGFEDFTTMWTWAEIEVERNKSNRDRVKDLRTRLKKAENELSDLKNPKRLKSDRVIKGEIERVPTPDPETVNPGSPAVNPGSPKTPVELEWVDPEPNPGPDNPEFEPTDAEKQAIEEMIEARIRINRTEVATYIREHRERLKQDGIATKRAAEVAAWGKWNANRKQVS